MMPQLSLVGKPSAGKSTFFAAATMVNVEISDRPFTTIKANEGIAYVRVEDIGPEFNVKSEPRQGFIAGKWRFVPIKLLDVAGLIEGAHEGRGLGNQFLSDAWKGEALLHVVDASGSTDAEGNFIGYGKRDPLEDIAFLERELDLWFLSILKRNWRSVESKMRAGKKKEEALYEALGGMVSRESIERNLHKPLEEMAFSLRRENKPILVVANKADLPHAKANIERMRERYDVVPTSAEIELALKRAAKAGLISYIPGEGSFEVTGKLTKEQEEALERMAAFLKEWGSTGVQDALEKATFELAGYIAVFPAGEKLRDKEGRVLPDCFLLRKGSTVKDFAEAIHSDLAKGLLYGIDARTRKRVAKDHVLKHRDAVEIVSAAKK